MIMETYDPNHTSTVDTSPIYPHHEFAQAVSDRRELDAVVRDFYDRTGELEGRHMSREHEAMLVRGGANHLHRFGFLIGDGATLRIKAGA